MIVDDDLDFRDAVCAVLEHAGYGWIALADSLEALRCLEASPLPDLILLDLTQPDMDGGQFVCAQRSRPALARIPVALVSGQRDLPGHAAALGVAGYLQKPVKLDELLAMVRRWAGPPHRGG